MDLYPSVRHEYTRGRVKPLYSVHGEKLAVLGHYEIKNGGVDTLAHLSDAYMLAGDLYLRYNVLMEGKNMSDGVNHAMKLIAQGFSVRVIHINTDVIECINSVRQRGHKIAERSIIRTHRKVMRDIKTFKEYGVNVFEGNRDECYSHVKELLQCTSPS
jgi:hypothetical protein